MKKIAILGSTGSIGTQTLVVVRANGDIEVLGISAGRNIAKLEEQIREFSPKLVAVWDENAARDLAQKIQDTDTKVVAGMDGLLELAAMPETEILVTYDRGNPCRQGHCAGKQGNSGNCRTSDHADGRGIWCEDPAGGQ